MVKYAEQHDTHSTATLLSRHIPPHPQNVSSFESLGTVYKVWNHVKWAGIRVCVCGSVRNHFLLVHSACMCAVRVCLVPKACHLGLSLTSSPYTRAKCASGKRQESDLYFVWHSCSRVPPRRQNAHWWKVGICPACLHWAYQHGPTRTLTHTTTGRHTLAIYTKRNWMHTPTLTHLGAESRERILL